MDPISDQFPHVSTYNYAENEPIANIDLWGLQAVRFETMFNNRVERLLSGQDTKQQFIEDGNAGAAGALIGATAVGTAVVAGPSIVAGATEASAAISTAVTGAIETSGTTMAINAFIDAAVQTVTNIADGENVITNFDITGTVGSAMSNPVVGSLIDGVVDVRINGSDINSAEEAVVGTAVGEGLGKAFGGVVDDIANSGQKLISNVVNAVTGLFRDTNETVGKKLADEKSQYKSK